MSNSVLNQAAPMESTREQLAEAGRDIRDRACEAGRAVQERAAELKQAVADGTAEVWSSVCEAGYDLKQRAAADIVAARGVAEECMGEGRARLGELGSAIELRVRSQPLTSVLIAAGAGFILGALWSRR